jgi:3'(2'), 5'-bisphosphate nucleotidase
MTDETLAAALAAEAGEFLLRRREQGDLTPDQLRPAGDAGAQQVLARRLREERPADAVLSEEARDSAARLSASRVWIIDPLDGTREYGEGRADWAVHVALWVDGDLAAGAVAIPAEGLTLSSGDPLPRPSFSSSPTSRVRLAVSRSRPPAFVTALAEALDAELVPMGSAGVKATAVLRGFADAYVHAGGQYEWDSAAPVAVARASGLHTSRIDGSPLRYNQPDPLLPDLVVALPEVADQILGAIAQLTTEVAAR